MKQNYPENVIVTIRSRSFNLEEDVRLPADSVFEYRRTYLDPYALAVSYNGRKLQSNDTLASLGAWDGSVLWLEER